MSNDLSLNLKANVDDFTTKITQAGNLTDMQVKRMARAFESLARAQNANARAQKEANDLAGAGASMNSKAAETLGQFASVSSKAAEGAKRVGHNVEQFGLQSAGAKRELLVLMHEMSQGNWTRLGGSLMVLGERTNAMGLLFSSAGAAALGVTAALGAFVTATAQAAIEASKFNSAILATGNYSGQTADRFKEDAEKIAQSTTTSVRAVRAIQLQLIATGQIGPREMGAATEAVVKMERVSGQSSDEIVKDFVRMQDGVTKWAEEHNRSMHFMSAAQIEHLRALEQTGQREQAVGEVLDRLNDRLNTEASLWDRVRRAAGDAWSAMAHAPATPASQLDIINERLAVIDRQAKDRLRNPAFAPSEQQLDGAREVLQTERRTILMKQLRDFEKAAGDAEQARVQQAGTAANEYIAKLREQIKGVDTLKVKLAEARRMFADAAAAGTPVAAADQAAMLAEIRKKNAGPAAPALSAIRDPQQEQKMMFLASEKRAYGEIAKYMAEQTDAEAKRSEQVGVRLGEQQARAERFVGSLKEESTAVYMTASARRLLNEQLRIEVERKRLLVQLGSGAKPAEIATINGWAAAAEARAQQASDEAAQRAGDPVLAAARAAGKWTESATDQAANAERLVTGSFDRMATAVENFAKTGKLNLGDLFSFMASEYLRQMSRMAIAQFIPGGGGLSGLMGMFGKVFGGSTAALANFTDANVAGAFADGGYTASGKSYLVGERGPEIFKPTGSGDIIPLSQQSGGGGGATINVGQGQVINVGQGVSRAEVYSAVTQANAHQEARIRRLTREGVFA